MNQPVDDLAMVFDYLFECVSDKYSEGIRWCMPEDTAQAFSNIRARLEQIRKPAKPVEKPATRGEE